MIFVNPASPHSCAAQSGESQEDASICVLNAQSNLICDGFVAYVEENGFGADEVMFLDQVEIPRAASVDTALTCSTSTGFLTCDPLYDRTVFSDTGVLHWVAASGIPIAVEYVA
jgi:hypothetical protein